MTTILLHAALRNASVRGLGTAACLWTRKNCETVTMSKIFDLFNATDDLGNAEEKVPNMLTCLRARRRELGLTQAHLAEAVGVSRQTIIAIEGGDYSPSVYLALRIAATLKSSVEELFSTQDPPTPTRKDRSP
ncbi:helix-turn-helix transcriptional regulator [Brevibacterium ammoniilyticum]